MNKLAEKMQAGKAWLEAHPLDEEMRARLKNGARTAFSGYSIGVTAWFAGWVANKPELTQQVAALLLSKNIIFEYIRSRSAWLHIAAEAGLSIVFIALFHEELASSLRDVFELSATVSASMDKLQPEATETRRFENISDLEVYGMLFVLPGLRTTYQVGRQLIKMRLSKRILVE